MPRGPEVRGSVDYEKPQGLDTLAGGTPICVYRQCYMLKFKIETNNFS
jgi:hypothetical protein